MPQLSLPARATVAFAALQGILVVAALWPAQIGVMIGIGDSHLVFAATIAVLSNLRWSLRGPLVLLIASSGCGIHYVCAVYLSYPFIFAEEYLVALLLAIAIALLLWLARGGGRAVAGDVEQRAVQQLRFSLADMFVWIVAAALLIAIGRRAMELTDVSGMIDPWEALQFATADAPSFILWRLPLLSTALVLHAVAWTLIVNSGLGEGSARKSLVRAAILLVALSLGELVLGAVTLLFKQPWPLLPVSMFPPAMLAWRADEVWEGTSEISDHLHRITEIAAICSVRICAVGGSLWFLKAAGMRVNPRR